jgi:hypothetical protein
MTLISTSLGPRHINLLLLLLLAARRGYTKSLIGVEMHDFVGVLLGITTSFLLLRMTPKVSLFVASTCEISSLAT